MAGVHFTDQNTVLVSYPVREAQQTITRAEYNMAVRHPNRVEAIKFMREQYGLALYEAMQMVDTISPRKEG